MEWRQRIGQTVQRLSSHLLVRNTLWMMAGQGVRLAIQAVYFIEIARSLGVHNYGAFVGVVALVGIAFPFGSMGSGNLLVRQVSRNPSSFRRCWGRSLTVTICCGSILLGAVLLLSRFALNAEIPLRLVALVGVSDILGLNLITLAGQSFLAFERLQWTAAIWITMSIARLSGALILVGSYAHPSALEWGYLYCASNVVVALAAFFLVCRKLGLPQFRWLATDGGIREGFYFSVSISAETIYNDIDKTMLARLATLDAAGVYGAAYRLIDVSTVPIAALLASAYSKLFRVGLGGIGSTFVYTGRLLTRSLAYASVVCILLQLSAGVIPHILGAGYAQTVEALRWLSVLPMLKSVHYFLADTLTGADYQGLRSLIQVGVAAFNILINLWIIPLYSWRGAAWSSIASDGLLACVLGVSVLVLRRRDAAAREASENAVFGCGI
jgi:O-antigen/teichoic acid export membrane protein